jgi:hypothetical protein
MLDFDIIPWTYDNFSHSIGFGGSLLAMGTAPLDESAGRRCRVIFVERQGQVRDTRLPEKKMKVGKFSYDQSPFFPNHDVGEAGILRCDGTGEGGA